MGGRRSCWRTPPSSGRVRRSCPRRRPLASSVIAQNRRQSRVYIRVEEFGMSHLPSPLSNPCAFQVAVTDRTVAMLGAQQACVGLFQKSLVPREQFRSAQRVCCAARLSEESVGAFNHPSGRDERDGATL